MTDNTYIIGIGNPDRGDDGVGRHVARQLQNRLHNGYTIMEQNGEVAGLVLALQQADSIWLIDASSSDTTPPGTIQRFDAGAGPIPQRVFSLSTHGFGLAEAIELARATCTLPVTCIVYAIEGHSFDHGQPMSKVVLDAANELVEIMLEEIFA